MGRPPKIHPRAKKDKPSKQRRREHREGLSPKQHPATVTAITPKAAREAPRRPLATDFPFAVKNPTTDQLVSRLIPPDAVFITESVADQMRAAGIQEADIQHAIEEGATWSRERQSLSFPLEYD